MNRRKFLTMLGLAPAVASNASLLAEALRPETDAEYYHRKRAEIPIEKRDDLIGGWVSYRFHYTVSLPPERRLTNVMKPAEHKSGVEVVARRPYVRDSKVDIG